MPRVNLHLEAARQGKDEIIRCDCGRIICGSTENYKQFVLRYDGPLREAGPERIYNGRYKNEERFVFRQFFCPQCLTLLECEVTPKGSPVLRDYEPAEAK